MTWIAVGVTGGSALLGYFGQKKQPTQQTQTNAQGGTTGYTSGAVLDGNANASINYGLNQARDVYRDGGGMSPLYGQAQSAIGQGLTGQQSFGGYQSSGGVNPYADVAFNAAADATQNRLSGEFARSGRNLAASQPARSQELQHLAAGIYAPAAEAEAGRQYGAAENSANRGLSAYQGALGASPYYGQTAQNASLDQYLGRVQGMAPMLPQTQYGNSTSTGTGSQTQPLYSNPAAGAMGGALLGQNLLGAFGGYPTKKLQTAGSGIYDFNSGGYIPGT